MRGLERGKLLFDVSLKELTTWKIGGTADQLYWPHDLFDLQNFIKTVPKDTPITWLGLGSNSLVSDKGVRGVVILTQGALKEISEEFWESPDGNSVSLIRAESGAASAQAARFSVKLQRTGIEFLAGVPGSIGGALVMNAGACGGEAWQYVHHVETLDREGVIHERFPQDFEISYRSVKGLPQDEWFVSAYFQLPQGVSEEAQQKIREYLDHRTKTQPANLPSCGCVFKNPVGNYASKMIDELGLKGTEVGGLKISDKHANFMINTGTATAKDAENLIALVQQKAQDQYGVLLHPEVKLIGDF
jgi:UDP-N-acetylenolpyruvoylglucosamine reductase